MLIQVASDLHLEFYQKFEQLSAILKNFVKADYLFLAGDIGYPDDLIWQKFIEWTSQNYKRVFYVIGNHESYGSVFETTNSKIRMFFQTFSNVVLLEEGVVEKLEEYTVVGCTLWTNLDEVSANFLNDTRMIEREKHKYIDAAFVRDLHSKAKEWLAYVLEQPSIDKEKTLVMTHHLPSYKCVVPQYFNSPFNNGFVGDVENLIPKSKLWIFGHTHSHVDITIEGTRVFANPRGYLSELKTSNFKVEAINI